MGRGRIRDEDIDRLREQASIVDVISDYVQLKKAGRYLKGLCPFHDEKTPSFMVDPAKQLYHCFGCGEGGNVFTFLKKKEGLDFREAAERLAARTGFTLHYEGVTKESGEAESRRGRLYRLNQWAADLYQDVLLKREAGKPARDYLVSRGIDREAALAFKLGYAPGSWDFLYREATRKGFSAQDFMAVGLGLQGEKGIYDRFRGRLIFPIQDLQDRVIAFGGRIIAEGQPKYLNSPETPIYTKSRHLYALNLARREIVREGFAVLVEGYTDVIGLWRAGIRNAAATLGTALGEEHIKQLSRLTERVVLAFDADAAGISASERGLDFYDDYNLDLRVTTFEEGMDPADLVSSRGPDEFRLRVEQSVPLVDFCLEKVLEEHDPSDTNSRLRGVRKAVHLVGGLGREIGAERYIKEIADWAGSGYQAVYELYRREHGDAAAGRAVAPEASISLPPHVRVERELLRLIVHHPFLLETAQDELDMGLFDDPGYRIILQALLESPGNAGDSGREGEGLISGIIEELESEQVRNTATALVFDKSGNVDNVSGDDAQVMYGDMLLSLKEFYFERQIRRLKKELESHASASRRDHAREQELTEEIFALERLKRELRQGH
ncbi:MAG: DNA primase [Actinomycetota bacterium]|nr:DNA primase [Actinomycetota bacterium]MDD5667656.1 DNA primase [Actinomycetota bacterium]